jgi:hypothetical protein
MLNSVPTFSLRDLSLDHLDIYIALGISLALEV